MGLRLFKKVIRAKWHGGPAMTVGIKCKSQGNSNFDAKRFCGRNAAMRMEGGPARG
jgi:hypothetical protein